MVAMNDIKARREEILRICESHGGHNVRVFGSVARGEETTQSDIDILLEFEKGRSLFDQIGLIDDLTEFFHQKVDVVSEPALNRHIREQVLKEAVAI